MPLTDEQKKIIELVDGSLVVVAGPGSGKTHTIIEKIFTLFETETIPEPYGLLAITFTNAAARVLFSGIEFGLVLTIHLDSTCFHVMAETLESKKTFVFLKLMSRLKFLIK